MNKWYNNGFCANCNKLVLKSEIDAGKAVASKTKRKSIIYLCENCKKEVFKNA